MARSKGGNKRITRWYGVMPPSYQKIEYYKCDKCGLTANLSKTNHQARINWNKMIEEKMKETNEK